MLLFTISWIFPTHEYFVFFYINFILWEKTDTYSLCLVNSTTEKYKCYSLSCPTLCDPMNCSSWASSVHEILWARTLEWGAISFSRRETWIKPESPALQGSFSTVGPPGKSLKDDFYCYLLLFHYKSHPPTHTPSFSPSCFPSFLLRLFVHENLFYWFLEKII